jgi:hypothetical protein
MVYHERMAVDEQETKLPNGSDEAQTTKLREYKVPKLTISATPSPAFDAEREFLELRIEDPLSFSALELERWGRVMRSFVSEVSREQVDAITREANYSASKLMSLGSRRRSINMSLRSGLTPATLLPLTLDNFKHLVNSFGDFHRQFGIVMAMFDTEPERYEPMLTTARDELAFFQKQHRLVTAEHVVLQSHLEHLVWHGMPEQTVESVSKADALYRPLVTLRDEYFTSPKNGLLQRYLETAMLIKESEDFKSLVVAGRLRLQRKLIEQHISAEVLDARLPAVEAELEVVVMLEQVDERGAHVSG